ncbi:hypothetical protein [Pseudosulfitobacter koreensis]|uniref:Conjugal transfer protein TrbI n=1 Tax=Pseudosulfitobacter koreensis TaxID=2968472 RepID=A0ABT1YZU7_9RHOB|nr:hypothetical protein [Pseudosulfitobacter koreense]MCR8826415.1 hypothetical protein [Pseudosulfitobacter koreense]
MSAPDTEIEKQSKRHSPLLIGMAIALTVAFIAGVIYLFGGFDPETDEATSAEPAANQQTLTD